MRNSILASAISSAFILAYSGAQAADLGVAPAAIVEPATAYSWSGAYVGAQAGYTVGGHVQDEYIYIDAAPWFNYDLSPDGAFGGLYAGYNYQFSNNIVLGAEADFALGNVGASGATIEYAGYDSSTDIDWTGSVRARVGYAFDRFLPYATGGVAFGRFSFEERAEDYGVRQSADVNVSGWTVGAGVEYALTDNVTLRGEYRLTDFNKKDFTGHDDAGLVDDFVAQIRTQDLRIGVAYKF